MAKSKIEKPPVRIEKSREYLRYDFSEEELKEFAKGMARTHQELAQVEEEKTAVVAQFKSDIEAKTKAIGDFSRRINNGYEHRNIDCQIRFNDPESGMKTLMRMDTGEIVRITKMSEAEKQEELPFKDDQPEPAQHGDGKAPKTAPW